MPTSATAPDVTDAEIELTLWIYAAMEDQGVTRANAPSLAAWNMLLAARQSPSGFYARTLPRALNAAAGAVHAKLKAAVDVFAQHPPSDRLAAINAYQRGCDLQRLESARAEVVADVRAMVDEWQQESGVTLSGHCSDALIAELVEIVDHCRAAAEREPRVIAALSSQ